jgi:hypothetical protein
MLTYPTVGVVDVPSLRQVGSLDLGDPLKPWLETEALLDAQGLWPERAIHRNGPHLEFDVKTGGESWRINYGIGNRGFRADPVDRRMGSISLRNFMTRLHTSHGFPNEARPHYF